MALINIAAFGIGLLVLSYVWKKSLVEIAPVLTCILVLTLYVLGLLRHLGFIDVIGIGVIAVFCIWLIGSKSESRISFGKACIEKMTEASFLAALLLIAAVILCTSQKVVTWWDDINFWATDVKSLYYLDGFASKYGNVASEFGDYPPGAQLFKWWFLHFSPHEFREGLAFAGYYVLNLVFMLPLFRNLKRRNLFLMLFMAAAVWFLPSMAEVYGYDGFCADLTMACIYGGFLFAVTEYRGEKDSFYYSRLALYLSVLVLVKSVGFIWAVFGLVFLFCYQHICNGERNSSRAADVSEVRKRHKLSAGLLTVCLTPVAAGGSWMLFCLMMRRVTKTTTTAVKYMTTDEYGISGYTIDYAKAFLEAFFTSPLHKEKGIALDMTPFAFYLCICLLVVFFYRRNMLPKRQGRLVLWFSVISGLIFYGIIFIAHITIFATETQYLEASGMISSIERYGAPFTVGTLIFLANIWLTYGDNLFQRDKMPFFLQRYGTCLCFVLAVALTAGYQAGYQGLISYRTETEAQLAARAEMLDADADVFLEAIQRLGTKKSDRVCYIQRDDAPRWVKNSYVNYEASPISVVYKSVNLDDAVTDWMVQEIRDSHAGYLYVEETAADAGAVFDVLTENTDFSCEVLYRIEDDGGQMRLVQVDKD